MATKGVKQYQIRIAPEAWDAILTHIGDGRYTSANALIVEAINDKLKALDRAANKSK